MAIHKNLRGFGIVSLLILGLGVDASAQSSGWPFIFNQDSLDQNARFRIARVLTNGKAVGEMKFESDTSSISVDGLRLLGTTLTQKGRQSAIQFDVDMDSYTGQKGRAVGEIGVLSAWVNAGHLAGIQATTLPVAFDNFSSSSISYGVGALLNCRADTPLVLDGVGTYWVGGSFNQLTGTYNGNPGFGAIAAVIGVDNADTTSTADHYAGWFDGEVKVTGDVICNSVITTSSRRWKSDIETIENPLDMIHDLRGVRYTWKANGDRHVGFIAEEVAEVLPEVVSFEQDGETARGVDYSRMTAVLIEAVKAQQAQIEAQQYELEELRAEMNVLQQR